MKTTVTLQQLCQMLSDKQIDNDLSQCLRDISASYELQPERTSEREYKIRQHLIRCAEMLEKGDNENK